MKTHELKTVLEVFEKKVLEIGETKLISNRNLQIYEQRLAQNANIVNEQGKLIQFYRNSLESLRAQTTSSNDPVIATQIDNVYQTGEAAFEKLKDVIAPPVFPHVLTQPERQGVSPKNL